MRTLETAQQLLATQGKAELVDVAPEERAEFTAAVVSALPGLPAAAVREALLDCWVSWHERNQATLRSAGLTPPPAAMAASSQIHGPAMQLAALVHASEDRDNARVPGAGALETTTAVKSGFSWMPTVAPAAAGLPSATARAAAALDAVHVKRGVLHGVVPDEEIAGIEDPNLVRFTLPARAAGVVASQMRDTNAALLNPMAFDIAERLHTLCGQPASKILADAPGVAARIKVLPHAAAAHASLPTAEVPSDITTGLDELFGVHKRAFEMRELIADSGSAPDDSAFPGATFLRAPVGEYGPDLALALVDAARILLRESAAVAAQTKDSSAYAEMNLKLVIGDDVAMSWRQGIDGLCSAVALLTGKRVAGKSVDEVLASLADGSVLLQLAARAPFYSAEPLAGSGHISKEPLIIDERGKARLPVAVVGFTKDAGQVREEFSAEATSDYAHAHMKAGAQNSTETRRGCPLAAKAPLYDASGALQMPDHSAIEELGSAYIELVRHLLRVRQGAAQREP